MPGVGYIISPVIVSSLGAHIYTNDPLVYILGAFDIYFWALPSLCGQSVLVLFSCMFFCLNKTLVLHFVLYFIFTHPLAVSDLISLSPPHGKITIILHLILGENAIYSVFFPWGGVPPLMFPLSDSVV